MDPTLQERKIAGYVIGQLKTINDADAFSAYQLVAGPTIAQYGGKMVLLSSSVEAGDGDWSPMGIVLFEFKSADQARKWYNSPEYHAVIGQRLASTESNTVIIDVE